MFFDLSSYSTTSTFDALKLQDSAQFVLKYDTVTDFQDPLGSPIMIAIQETGATQNADVLKLSQQLFEPWGVAFRIARFNEAGDQEFTGKKRDESTPTLFEFGFRFYDLQLGTFLGKDLVGADFKTPVTLNPFLFCLNNPVRYVDPDGKDAVLYTKWSGSIPGIGGHTGLYFQDTNGTWYKSDLNIASLSWRNLFGILGQGKYDVTPIKNFNLDSVMKEYGPLATHYQTTPQQDKIISEKIFAKEAAINSGHDLYSLFTDNCKFNSYGALKAANVDVLNTPQPGPNLEWALNFTNQTYNNFLLKSGKYIYDFTTPTYPTTFQDF